MNYSLAIIFCLLSLALAAPSDKLPLSVNVKDFGAKGDGQSDDTESIQAAINEAGRLSKTIPFPWTGAYPEIVFPEGTYPITRTLLLGVGADPKIGMQSNGKPSGAGKQQGGGFAYVRGVGKATIKQVSPNKDIFYVGDAFRIVIEKLSFEGGNRGIRLWNGNHDKCVIIIRDCHFQGTRQYAIEMSEIHVSLSNKAVSGYARLDERGDLVEVEDPDAPALAFSSTYLHVYHCDFNRCGAVLFSACDMATMEDCRIETSPEMKGAAIRAVGLLKLENIRGVAHVREGNAQRWIDLAFGNVPQLYARGLNLSSDSAAGIPVVYSLVRLRLAGNANHAVVVLQDSQFQVSGCPENAVVYCQEAPNKIVISGCVQTGKTEVPAIGLSGKHIDEDYFESFDNIGSRDLTLVTNRGAWIPMPAEGLAYLIDDDNKNIGAVLPAPMLRYARLPLAKPIRAIVKKWSEAKKDEILSENYFLKNISRRLNAADFGIVGDGVSDDSEAIQKAFDAAAGAGLTELTFPAKIFKINRPIRVPSEIVVRGSGRAVFITPSAVEGGLVVPDARRVAFLNLSFDSGKKQLSMVIGKGTDAQVLVDNCSFQNAADTALSCRSMDESPSARSRSAFRVMNGVFDNNWKDLFNNVNAVVDSLWIATYLYSYKNFADITTRSREQLVYPRLITADDPYQDLAVICNEGTLRIENIIGVPLTRTFKREIRWIDSSGPLFVDYFRFGGENSGFPAVYLRHDSSGQKTGAIIQNCWMNHKLGKFYYPDDNDAVKPSAAEIHSEVLPELLVMVNNAGSEKNQIPNVVLGPTVQIGPRVPVEAFKERLHFSANTLPEELGTRELQGASKSPIVRPIRLTSGSGPTSPQNLVRNGSFEKLRSFRVDASVSGSWGELLSRGVELASGSEAMIFPKDWSPNPAGGWVAAGKHSLKRAPGYSGSNGIQVTTDKYATLISDAPIPVNEDPKDNELSSLKPGTFSFYARGKGVVTLNLTTYLKSGANYNACKAVPSEFVLEKEWKRYEGTLEFISQDVVEARCYLRVTGGDAVLDEIEIRRVP